MAGDPAEIRILIVEDDEQTRVLYSAKLREFTLETARNGADGLEKFRAFAPHVVITDLTMPHMDGCELVRCIRSQPSDVPVIVVTGINVKNPVQGEKVEEALRSGASRALSKPFSRAELVAVIEDLLEDRA